MVASKNVLEESVALWEFGAMMSSFLKSWIWLYQGIFQVKTPMS